jgi:hypothetical protein
MVLSLFHDVSGCASSLRSFSLCFSFSKAKRVPPPPLPLLPLLQVLLDETRQLNEVCGRDHYCR